MTDTPDSPPRFVSERRRPCKRGEYIVVSLTGPGAIMNTMIIGNAADADEAMAFRSSQCAPENREGAYLVTNGRASAFYSVECGGDKIERVHDSWWGCGLERWSHPYD